MKHFKKRRKLNPMITLVNIVFLLLGFFLMGRFETSEPLAVMLPRFSMGQDESTIDKTLILDATGNMYLDGQPLAHIADMPDLSGVVLLRMDKSIDADMAIKLMAALEGKNQAYLVEVQK